MGVTFDNFDLGGSPLAWPIPAGSLTRIGQSVLPDRDGTGRPHFGVDLFAPAHTPVLSASGGRVLLVRDGRTSTDLKKRRAGLWLEVSFEGLVYRYMHLGSVVKAEGERVRPGMLVGFVAPNAAGEPHLHFEIRRGTAKGDALDPLRLLPHRRGTNA